MFPSAAEGILNFMRIFHLSDLHIGLKLINRDLRQDQEYVLHEIAELAAERKPDAVVIAGDIYDKAVPSAEAVEVFDRFVSELVRAVPEAELMMISGNHDSAGRVNVFRSVLRRQHIHMIGIPPQRPDERIERVTLEDRFGKVHFYLLPFVKPSMVREITGTDENGNALSYDAALHRLLAREHVGENEEAGDRHVLVSHQFYLPKGQDPAQAERMDSEVRTLGNIDVVYADALEPFDYAALGHIHKPMKVGCERYRYCGTPIAASVSEAGQQKAVLEVELGAKGELAVTPLPLRPLHEVQVLEGTLEEVLRQASENYVTVILTDRVDLDVLDMQDRLREAFPNLLEIRRQTVRGTQYQALPPLQNELGTYELCAEFLKDLDEEEQELLQDVIHSVQESSGRENGV